jgi:hypothetical protein
MLSGDYPLEAAVGGPGNNRSRLFGAGDLLLAQDRVEGGIAEHACPTIIRQSNRQKVDAPPTNRARVPGRDQRQTTPNHKGGFRGPTRGMLLRPGIGTDGGACMAP